MAAISAAQAGAPVTLLEAHPYKLGSSILRSGNGRCNIFPAQLSPNDFNAPHFITQCFKQFHSDQGNYALELTESFRELGLLLHQEDQRMYPYSQSAHSVVDLFIAQLKALDIELHMNSRVSALYTCREGFKTQLEDGRSFTASQLILAAGSAEYIQLDKTLSRELSHKPRQACLCPLLIESPLIKGLSGIRCQADLSMNTANHSWYEKGELLFRDYGLSGIVAFNASRQYLLHDIDELNINFVPTLSEEELADFLEMRLQTAQAGIIRVDELLSGICHPQLGRRLISLSNPNFNEELLKAYPEQKNLKGPKKQLRKQDKHAQYQPLESYHVSGEPLCSAHELSVERLLQTLCHHTLKISGLTELQLAQVKCGGYDLQQFNEHSLEHKNLKGFHVSGEALDIDGPCGGYNLAWAWLSGKAAGIHAAQQVLNSKGSIRA